MEKHPSTKRRNTHNPIRNLLTVLMALLLLCTSMPRTVQAANEDPLTIFYDALIETLDTENFAFRLEVAHDRTTSEGGIVGIYPIEYLQGNMEFDLDGRELELQIAAGEQDYGQDGSIYLYFKNGTFRFYEYDYMNWEEMFLPALTDLFSVLKGDTGRLTNVLTAFAYELDITEVPYDLDTLVDLIPDLLNQLCTKEVYEDILNYTKSGNTCILQPDIVSLINWLIEETETAYTGFGTASELWEEALGDDWDDSEYIPYISISFTVDEGLLTSAQVEVTSTYTREYEDEITTYLDTYTFTLNLYDFNRSEIVSPLLLY